MFKPTATDFLQWGFLLENNEHLANYEKAFIRLDNGKLCRIYLDNGEMTYMNMETMDGTLETAPNGGNYWRRDYSFRNTPPSNYEKFYYLMEAIINDMRSPFLFNPKTFPLSPCF